MFSGPEIFDGRADRPYVESALRSPGTITGRSLEDAERQAAWSHHGSLIVRRGYLFGPGLEASLGKLEESPDIITPAYLPDVANAMIDLLIDGESGVWHVCSESDVTSFEFLAALRTGLSLPVVPGIGVATNSRMRALTSDRGWLLPPWKSAVRHYVDHFHELILNGLSPDSDVGRHGIDRSEAGRGRLPA